jgi:hypothetical protein
MDVFTEPTAKRTDRHTGRQERRLIKRKENPLIINVVQFMKFEVPQWGS